MFGLLGKCDTLRNYSLKGTSINFHCFSLFWHLEMENSFEYNLYSYVCWPRVHYLYRHSVCVWMWVKYMYKCESINYLEAQLFGNCHHESMIQHKTSSGSRHQTASEELFIIGLVHRHAWKFLTITLILR